MSVEKGSVGNYFKIIPACGEGMVAAVGRSLAGYNFSEVRRKRMGRN